jgi:hypothetical protein
MDALIAQNMQTIESNRQIIQTFMQTIERLTVRALANRDYLGYWFARITHRGRSPLTCIVPKALPGKAPGALPAVEAQ